MGILGYPNMDDNNQDGVFGNYSDVYSNFSEEETNIETTEHIETSDMTFDEQAAVAANMPINEQKKPLQENINQETPQQDDMSLQQRREANAANNSKANGFVLVLLILAFIAGGIYYYKNNIMTNNNANETQAMGDYFYDAAGAGKTDSQKEVKQQEDLATIEVNIDPTPAQPKEQKDTIAQSNKDNVKKEKTPQEKVSEKEKNDEKKPSFNKPSDVVIQVAAGGRVDPFLPANEKSIVTEAPKFDIVAPPVDIPTEIDPMIEKMSSFRITGIMYDDVRPSALLTIDGSEQLVHKGDLIAGYEIKDITRTKVVVKYNTNVFEVSAGENIKYTGANVNPVSTLNNQFGGAYSKTPDNAMKFY